MWGWKKQKSEDLKHKCYVVVLHSDVFPRLSLIQFIRYQIQTVSVKMSLNTGDFLILSEETTQTSRWSVKTSVSVYFRPRSASQINSRCNKLNFLLRSFRWETRTENPVFGFHLNRGQSRGLLHSKLPKGCLTKKNKTTSTKLITF